MLLAEFPQPSLLVVAERTHSLRVGVHPHHQPLQVVLGQSYPVMSAFGPEHSHQRACFRCTVAVALPDGTVYYSEGTCRGEIVAVERGTRGFGYDPVFQVADEMYGGRTMAELSLAQKHTLSHRANALRGAFPILYELLSAEK